MRTPKVSFVMVGRNDNYGGNFLHRINVSVQTLIGLCERFHFSSELVIVEWNPPRDRKPLVEAIAWPIDAPQHIQVRIVEVPETVHRQLPGSSRIPLFEYIAKNVGVRRSHGEFVLVTNPDIVFSSGLIRTLESKHLSADAYHRTARYDVASPVPDGSVDAQLRYCRRHILRSLGYVFSTDWQAAARWNLYRRVRAMGGYCKRAYWHRALPTPYTVASGDFFLMHRNAWFELRGYPEMKSHSHHDSYLTYCAHASGRRLRIFWGRDIYLYHQDHGRQEHANRPTTSWEECVRRGYEMTRSRKAMSFNSEDWGLATERLPETTPYPLRADSNFASPARQI